MSDPVPARPRAKTQKEVAEEEDRSKGFQATLAAMGLESSALAAVKAANLTAVASLSAKLNFDASQIAETFRMSDEVTRGIRASEAALGRLTAVNDLVSASLRTSSLDGFVRETTYDPMREFLRRQPQALPPSRPAIDLEALAGLIAERLDLDALAEEAARRMVEIFNGAELDPDRERIGFRGP